MGCGASKITAIETATALLDKCEDNKEKLVKNSEQDQLKIDHSNSNNFNSRQRLIFKHRLSSIHESACEHFNPHESNSVAVQATLENSHQLSQTDDLASQFTVNQDEFEKWLKMVNIKTLSSNFSLEDVNLNIIERIRTIGSSVLYNVGVQAAQSKRASSTQTFTTLIKPILNAIQKDHRSSLQISSLENSSDHQKFVSGLVEDILNDGLDEDHNLPASISTPLAHVEKKLNNHVEEKLNLNNLKELFETTKRDADGPSQA